MLSLRVLLDVVAPFDVLARKLECSVCVPVSGLYHSTWYSQVRMISLRVLEVGVPFYVVLAS